MSSSELKYNKSHLLEIIFDEYLDDLPENYNAGEYYLNDSNYNTLNEIIVDIEAAQLII